MPNKLVKYNNRNFDGLRQNLLNFVKQYYPENFSSVSDYSIEMLLLELNAYTGDVLNYYLDDQNKERYLQFATERESLFRIAKTLGYKTKTVSIGLGEITVSQRVPSKLVSGEYVPDSDYCATIQAGMVASNASNTTYVTTIEVCNMKNYTDSVVETRDANANPTNFIISKNIKVRTGRKQQKTISLTDPVPYLSIFVDQNVAYIESVVDSEGNKWYEVDYLSRDITFDSVQNDMFNVNSNDAPQILQIKRVPRRFEVEHKSNGECYLKFGSGIDTIDETLRPITPDDLLSNNNEVVQPTFNSSFVVEQFINNDSFGLTPFNTTLNITYVTSRGEIDNIKSNNISTISQIDVSFDAQSVPANVRNSFIVSNENEIIGSTFLNSSEQLKELIPKAYSSQNRCVTPRDYMLRTILMPKQFGNVSKVFSQVEKQNSQNVLSLYIVTTNLDGKFVNATETVKTNLSGYLKPYKSENDIVLIKNAYIVNFSINVDLVVKDEFEAQEVDLEVSRKIQEFFSNQNMEINKAIIIKELENKIYEVEGVRYIKRITFENKFDTNNGYSGVSYTLTIEDGVVYPPANPSIFEIKFPQKDISITNV